MSEARWVDRFDVGQRSGRLFDGPAVDRQREREAAKRDSAAYHAALDHLTRRNSSSIDARHGATSEQAQHADPEEGTRDLAFR